MPGFNPSKDLMPTTAATCLEQPDDPMSDEEQVSVCCYTRRDETKINRNCM